MVLSDKDIQKALDEGTIRIDHMFPNSIGPASVDLHLGKDFLVFIKNEVAVIDPAVSVENMMREVEIDIDKPFILHAGEFALGVIEECTGINNQYVGRLDGKSGVGRLGTCVHLTASTLNPGNELCMTLELFNNTHAPIQLYWGMPIAQISFEQLSTPCAQSYLNDKGYGGSRKPQPSQYHKNFLKEKNSWRDFVKTVLSK